MNTNGQSRIPPALWAIVLFAYLLRVAVAVDWNANHPLADHPVIDEASYESWGVEIAEGDWVGEEVFFQEPLYPYWLGAVYSVFGVENRTAVRHTQAFLGALTVLLTALVARRLFGDSAALATAALVALYRPALLFTNLLLKPNLFLPILAGLVLCLLALRGSESRRRYWVLAGVLVGAGALLRGNMLLLIPFFAILPIVRARCESGPGGRTAALLTLAGVLLVLVPVAARNYAVGRVFALTTSGAGTNVYGGNNSQNPYGRATEFGWVRGIPEFEADDWRREAERRLERPLAPDEVSSYWLGETARSIGERPWEHARIFWNKLRLSLGSYEVPDNHHLKWDAQFVSSLRLPWPGWSVLGLLGLAGILGLGISSAARGSVWDRPGAMELALLALLYLGTIVATVTSMRARLALVPLLAPFAGWTLIRVLALLPPLRTRWSLTSAPGPGVLLVSLACAAVVVLTPVLSADERAADWAKRDFNHAVYLIHDGRLAEARALCIDLDRKYPGTSRIQTMLADLEFEDAKGHLEDDPESATGRALVESAIGRVRLVVESPGVSTRERFRGRKLAGRIQRYLGRAPAAQRFFAAALEFDPNDREALDGWTWSVVQERRASHVTNLEPSTGVTELDTWEADVRIDPLASTSLARAYASCGTAQLLLEGSERVAGAARAGLLQRALDTYRASRELDPEGRGILLGLANALFLVADGAPRASQERRAAADEAEAILVRLGADPRVGDGLAKQLEAVRALR